MKECFVPRDFSLKNRAVIRQANAIVDEFRDGGFILTLRQLYYQFVAKDLIENSIQSYKRLGDIINDARLAGLVDWDMIEDRTRNINPTPMWGDPGDVDSPAEFILDWGRHFKNNPWVNQPIYVECWIEKDALIGVIEGPCSKWRVPYFSCRGYVSASEMYGAAKRLEEQVEAGKGVIVLHLGDHDPSGTQMTDNVSERIDLLTRGLISERAMVVRRLALNMDQIRTYDPPPNAAKESDSRFRAYRDRYGTEESWELDSMQPGVLVDLIDDEIAGIVKRDLWDRDVAAEKEPRRQLLEVGQRWTEVREFMEQNDE